MLNLIITFQKSSLEQLLVNVVTKLPSVLVGDQHLTLDVMTISLTPLASRVALNKWWSHTGLLSCTVDNKVGVQAWRTDRCPDGRLRCRISARSGCSRGSGGPFGATVYGGFGVLA